MIDSTVLLPRRQLWRVSADAAGDLVDDLCSGGASPLINYRLESGWQRDWKEELGQWIAFAREHGFYDRLSAEVRTAVERGAKKGTDPNVRDPNDVRHLKLVQAVAPAMVAHFLCGTGMTFEMWNPGRTIRDGDIDLVVSAKGRSVMCQVKASDQPGAVIAHRIVNGENNANVLAGLEKGVTQLPREARDPSLLVMCAQRDWPVSLYPGFVLEHFVGRTAGRTGYVALAPAQRGRFYDDSMRHVGAVALIDYVLASPNPGYACTLLINPLAQDGAAVDPAWFSHARTLSRIDRCWRWSAAAPSDCGVPDGTLELV